MKWLPESPPTSDAQVRRHHGQHAWSYTAPPMCNTGWSEPPGSGLLLTIQHHWGVGGGGEGCPTPHTPKVIGPNFAPGLWPINFFHLERLVPISLGHKISSVPLDLWPSVPQHHPLGGGGPTHPPLDPPPLKRSPALGSLLESSLETTLQTSLSGFGLLWM